MRIATDFCVAIMMAVALLSAEPLTLTQAVEAAAKNYVRDEDIVGKQRVPANANVGRPSNTIGFRARRVFLTAQTR